MTYATARLAGESLTFSGGDFGPVYCSGWQWNRPGSHAIFGIMDTETSAAITALAETMKAGFARMDARFGAGDARFAGLEGRMEAGFARVDHLIELQQAQHVEFRNEFSELRAEVRGLRNRVDALTARVGGLEHEVSQLRDYVTREVAEIRLELRRLRQRADQTDELLREIAELTVRVDGLERRQAD
ncbi:MAG: hypothetical protein KFH98_10810 [Gemmatimonadetes bacterium]|nr:hypothetical protein [Gemmatimonadota bacterium]